MSINPASFGRLFHSMAIGVLACLALCGCNSLPSQSPIDQYQEFFDPRYLDWQSATDYSAVQGNWFRDGEIYLELEQDSLAIARQIATEWKVESSNSYYRIIYRENDHFNVIYLHAPQSDSLRYMPGDSTFTQLEEVNRIPASGMWRLLTSHVIWRNTQSNSEFIGNWHIADGNLELAVTPEQVTIDNEEWSLDSTQFSGAVKRLVLSRQDSTIALYFKNVTPTDVFVRIEGSTAPIENRYGYILSGWTQLDYWKDFWQASGLTGGNVVEYDYLFSAKVVHLDHKPEVPRHSISIRHQMQGRMRVSVTGQIAGNGDGEVELRVGFDIDNHDGYIRHNILSAPQSVVTDSAWTGLTQIAETQHKIVMEHDTLWLDTPEGKQYFAPRRLDKHSVINFAVFVFPFAPPLEAFPDTNGLNAKTVLPGGTEPAVELFPLPGDNQVIDMVVTEDEAPRRGMLKHSFAQFGATGVLEEIHYTYGSYALIYLTEVGYIDPDGGENYQDYRFTCELAN